MLYSCCKCFTGLAFEAVDVTQNGTIMITKHHGWFTFFSEVLTDWSYKYIKLE